LEGTGKPGKPEIKYQLLAYADDVNLLEGNTYNLKKSKETLTLVSMLV
jgi:hypothetical protein